MERRLFLFAWLMSQTIHCRSGDRTKLAESRRNFEVEEAHFVSVLLDRCCRCEVSCHLRSTLAMQACAASLRQELEEAQAREGPSRQTLLQLLSIDFQDLLAHRDRNLTGCEESFATTEVRSIRPQPQAKYDDEWRQPASASKYSWYERSRQGILQQAESELDSCTNELKAHGWADAAGQHPEARLSSMQAMTSEDVDSLRLEPEIQVQHAPFEEFGSESCRPSQHPAQRGLSGSVSPWRVPSRAVQTTQPFSISEAP